MQTVRLIFISKIYDWIDSDWQTLSKLTVLTETIIFY